MSDIFYDLQNQITGLKNQLESLRTNVLYPGIWQSWTPTITAFAGTFTTVSATGYYSKIAKVAPIIITVTITTNGTASGILIASLPFSVDKITVLSGRENASSGKMLQGLAYNSQVNVYNYDGTYPGADGYTLYLSGFISVT